MYLAGFVIECLLKAKLLERYKVAGIYMVGVRLAAQRS